MSGRKPFIFATEDVFGNTVSLPLNRWQHIVQGHPDMNGLQRAIQRTVENPSVIYQSSANTESLVFHAHGLLAPHRNIVRVILRYDDIAHAKRGTTEGHIVTAFTPSPAMELTGQIGRQYYERPKKLRRR